MEPAYKESYEFWDNAVKTGSFITKNPLDGTDVELFLPTKFPPYIQEEMSFYEYIYRELGNIRITAPEKHNDRPASASISNFGCENKRNKFASFYVKGTLGKLPWETPESYRNKIPDTRDSIGIQADANYLPLLVLADHYFAIQNVAALKAFTAIKGQTVETLLDVDGPFHRLGQARTASTETDVDKKNKAEQDIRDGRKLPYTNVKASTKYDKLPPVRKATLDESTGEAIFDAVPGPNGKSVLVNKKTQDLRFGDGVVALGFISGENYKTTSKTNVDIYAPTISATEFIWYSRATKEDRVGKAPAKMRIVSGNDAASVDQYNEQSAATAEAAVGEKRGRDQEDDAQYGITDGDMEALAALEAAERADAARSEKMRRLDA